MRAWRTAVLALLVLACSGARAAAQPSQIFPLDHYWSHELDAPFAAAPAADAARVYVALQTGRLIALSPATTAEVWSVDLSAAGAPVAADGRVFVPDAAAVHALDAATGRLAWRLPAGPLAAPLVYRTGWLIVALADGAVQGVRASDGVVMWAIELGVAASAAPSIDGNVLALPLADGRLVALDVQTGAVSWTRPLGGAATGVLVSGDRIFAGTRDGTFWSLETSDGDVDWRWRVGARFIGAPAADAAGVYAIAADNVVRGFSRDNGHQRWSQPLATRALAGPSVVDGVLVVTAGEVGRPGLTYFDGRTGTPSGRSPVLPSATETTRAQFPVLMPADAPQALLATATPAGDWTLHAYRQTFLTPTGTGPIVFGPRYEVRWRLEISTGVRVFGIRVPLVPRVP